MKYSSCTFDFPWGDFGLPLAPFWVPLGSFWLPLGCLWLPLAPFGVPLHSLWGALIWPAFGVAWSRFGALWEPVGSLFLGVFWILFKIGHHFPRKNARSPRLRTKTSRSEFSRGCPPLPAETVSGTAARTPPPHAPGARMT